MEPTLFQEWVDKFFPGVVLRITAKTNDEKTLLTYTYMKYLKPVYSVDGKWTSLSVNNSVVAADIIAMDSSIPLKARPSLGRAEGEIPKMGMELALREKQLTDINTLIALQRPESTIAARILGDVPLVINGVREKIELMFLEGLSTGITEIDDTENVGTGVRLNYGYLDANKFESTVSWDDPTAKPFTDMKPVLDKARLDGNTITIVMMDVTTFENISNTAEAKTIYAAAFGIFSATVPTPTLEQMNQATQKRFGFIIQTVDRTVRIQRDGVNTVVRPWKAGSVIFLTQGETLGSLVWATLAEQNHPVATVSYQVADQHILVSKFRLNRPSLAEFTNSQSRVVPVIDNPDAIYLLDSTQDNP